MIGLLGGTFDPIHFGHLRIALEVADALDLEQVRFIPNRVPPHRRQPLASGAERLAMIQSAIQGEPRFVADDRELRQEQTSYTVHTLQALHQEFPHQSWAFIIGADAFLQLTSWYEWQTLFDLTHFIVVGRPGYALTTSETTWFQPYLVDSLADLTKHTVGKVLVLNIQGLDISATQLRNLIARGQSPRYLTPDAVWSMIQTQQLYKSKV
ncbi:MAG: nicotinate-nucleotide adenylyltransferase [Thiofilum sp.]|uniref:nicotinate-nucleotide adenylyltransferase n=1 Tax=Thiofilum sp. TaxID=2212733 RepID=UPI0025CEAEEE|nr:nicotinate-nucleotide adenylyltransferase [Thiofilum sp.]MBK8453649.1 nicotinate-nucleotide adenylyltransferase [Thiofilum sp.]